MKKDILIIEDDKSIVRILELEFNHEGYTFDYAYDGKSGLELYNKVEYKILILDLMLPEISGLEVCRKIRKNSQIPIIMLTAKREVIDKVIGLDQGADDYITKPFEMEELLARIRVCMRRDKVKTNEDSFLQLSDLKINLLTRQVTKQDLNIELTKTEYDLLKYLVQNKRIVVTREQIIEHVWGFDYYGDTNILDVYIRSLRKKIDYPFSTNLIQTVRGVGYTVKE